MAWQAGTAWRAELRQCPLTGNCPSRGIKRSQGRALVPSNRASKLSAGKEPSTSSTRSPVRRFRLSRAMSSAEPRHSTRPFSAWTPSRFNRRISSAHRPSSPNRVGTAKVKSFTVKPPGSGAVPGHFSNKKTVPSLRKTEKKGAVWTLITYSISDGGKIRNSFSKLEGFAMEFSQKIWYGMGNGT